MTNLLLPYATNPRGDFVTPEIAVKGEEHRCPQCGDLVVLRQGEVKRAHFAHKPTAQCSAETVQHIVAKHAVATAAKSGASIDLLVPCAVCRHVTPFLLPQAFDTVTVEYTVPSGRIVDVALLGAQAALAVEVHQTHAVDEDKAADLGGMAWLEVEAADVLAQPTIWRAVQHNLSVLCPTCALRNRTINAIAARDDVVWDPETTTVDLIYCWKCHVEILAFDWKGVRPSNPMPWVVSYRWVQTTRSLQWVTFCPHCGQTQGSFYRGRDVGAWYYEKLDKHAGEYGTLLQPWERA